MPAESDPVITAAVGRNDPNEQGEGKDDAFELLDSGSVQQGDDGESADAAGQGREYWYAAADGSAQHGPVSETAVRKQIAAGLIQADDLIWRREMPEWVRVFDQPEFQGLRPSRADGPTPPPLPKRGDVEGVRPLFELLQHWNPPARVFRLIARCVLAAGLLVLLLSLILSPFGWSWFSGGLMLILITSVLEVAAVMREPANATEQRSPQ